MKYIRSLFLKRLVYFYIDDRKEFNRILNDRTFHANMFKRKEAPYNKKK